MAKRIVSNEELCTALINHGTIRDTANALNISERTVYNIMSTNAFKEIYEYTQLGILNSAINVCQDKLTEAITCIADIMNDKNVSPQTRLQAAQTIIKNTLSMYNALKTKREDAEYSHDCALWDITRN